MTNLFAAVLLVLLLFAMGANIVIVVVACANWHSTRKYFLACKCLSAIGVIVAVRQIKGHAQLASSVLAGFTAGILPVATGGILMIWILTRSTEQPRH